MVFRDPYRFKKRTELFIAAEGIHTGQFVYCGKKGKPRTRDGKSVEWGLSRTRRLALSKGREDTQEETSPGDPCWAKRIHRGAKRAVGRGWVLGAVQSECICVASGSQLWRYHFGPLTAACRFPSQLS